MVETLSVRASLYTHLAEEYTYSQSWATCRTDPYFEVLAFPSQSKFEESYGSFSDLIHSSTSFTAA
jgi:hypothetical protein